MALCKMPVSVQGVNKALISAKHDGEDFDILPSFLSALIGLAHLSERLVPITPDSFHKSTLEGSVYAFSGVRAAEVSVRSYKNRSDCPLMLWNA